MTFPSLSSTSRIQGRKTGLGIVPIHSRVHAVLFLLTHAAYIRLTSHSLRLKLPASPPLAAGFSSALFQQD